MLSAVAIQVTWRPPKYVGNGVFGYEVHYNKSSTNMDQMIPVSESVLGQEIRDLRPYTNYKVQVAVKSDTHNGPMSFVKFVQTLEAGKYRYRTMH